MTVQDIQQQIASQAAAAGISPALALAIAQQESQFQPSAVNSQNKNGTSDYGVFQLNSTNLASLGLNPLTALDPQANINAGVQFIAQIQAQYGTDPAVIASVYNTGSPNNTQSHYVSGVVGALTNYQGAPSGGADLYNLVSALPGDQSPYPVIDLSGIGLGDVALTPSVIAGVGLGLAGLLWLMSKKTR